MGGDHGHEHGHGRPYEIPDYRIFKTEDVPELARVQKMLALKGLKDPWMRNEVWRFHPKFGTKWTRAKGTFFVGFGVGLAAFSVALAIEQLWAKTHPQDDHHHGHGH